MPRQNRTELVARFIPRVDVHRARVIVHREYDMVKRIDQLEDVPALVDVLRIKINAHRGCRRACVDVEPPMCSLLIPRWVAGQRWPPAAAALIIARAAAGCTAGKASFPTRIQPYDEKADAKAL